MAESLCCTLKTITTLLISYAGFVCKSSLTLATRWTVTYHAPLSAGFSSKNNGGVAVSFPRVSSRARDLSMSLALQAYSSPTQLPGNSQSAILQNKIKS